MEGQRSPSLMGNCPPLGVDSQVQVASPWPGSSSGIAYILPGQEGMQQANRIQMRDCIGLEPKYHPGSWETWGHTGRLLGTPGLPEGLEPSLNPLESFSRGIGVGPRTWTQTSAPSFDFVLHLDPQSHPHPWELESPVGSSRQRLQGPVLLFQSEAPFSHISQLNSHP